MKQLIILILIVAVLGLVLATRGGKGSTPGNEVATTTESVSAIENGLTNGTNIKDIEKDLTALTIDTGLVPLEDDLLGIDEDLQQLLPTQ